MATQRLSCNIGPDDDAFLRDWARRKGTSRTAAIERAIRVLDAIGRADRVVVTEPDGSSREVLFL